MISADAISAPTSRTDPGAASPRVARPNRVKVFAREAADGTARIRFISDDLEVRDAALVKVVWLDRDQEPADVAAACADILAETPGMAADRNGWHTMPPSGRSLDSILGTLLEAAKNRAWAERAPAVGLAPDDADLPLAPLPGLPEAPPPQRQQWSLRRVAWFGFLVGLGWTAKRIAADALITSTPENVWRQAHRFGLSLNAAPQGQVCVDLPVATLAVIDKAAAAAHLQRDAFVKRLLIRAAKEPDRFGLTAAFS